MILRWSLLALALVLFLPAIGAGQAEPEPPVPQLPQVPPQAPEIAPPMAPPKTLQGASVTLSGNMLSIDATEEAFGDVISEVAKQGGFELKITNNVKQSRLSTKFTNVDLQKGIQRMMTLIGHKNYFIFYDSEGRITKLDIFEPGQKQPRKLNVPVVTQPSRQNLRRPSRRNVRTPSVTTPVTPSPPEVFQPTQPSPPEVFQPEPLEEMEDISEGEPGVPFIPPTTEPEYIPPSKR